MEREVPVEVIGRRTECHCHPGDASTQITVRRVALSRIRAGWTVSGDGRTSFDREESTHCPTCGLVCRVILTHLPIELDGVPCPTCRQPRDFAYDLGCVETEAGEFSFTATVRCPGCSSRTFTGRIADGLRRIKHLKLGPTGVEVDLE